jgi:branched-chain amino acid aminotransferase
MAEHAVYLWWNGEMKPWGDARVHVTTLGWSTMSAVFEGINSSTHDLLAS